MNYFLLAVFVTIVQISIAFKPIRIQAVQHELIGFQKHQPRLSFKSYNRRLCLRLNTFQKLDDSFESEFPAAVFVAGFEEESLETIDDILSEFLFPLPPIVILGASDHSNTLSNILYSDNNSKISSTLISRDHELPDKLLQTKVPVMLLSGLKNSLMVDIIRRWKYLSKNDPTLKLPIDCAFATVVSPALKKPFKQLITEITRDHIDNKVA